MGPNTLLLSYDVTYFDHTGWTDTFGNNKWDNRQRAYLKRWARNTIFTPQVIADGIADGTGAGNNEVMEIVNSARDARKSMPWHIVVDTNETELRVDSDGIDVGVHDIVLINYDPKLQVCHLAEFGNHANSFVQVVKVRKGPNKGKKITHRNLAKDVIKIGEWNGGNLTVSLPDMSQMAHTGLDTVAIVQGGNGGPIVAAQKL